MCVEFGQETTQPFNIVLKLNRDALCLPLQTYPEGFRVVFAHGGVEQTLERGVKASRVVEDVIDPISGGSGNVLDNGLRFSEFSRIINDDADVLRSCDLNEELCQVIFTELVNALFEFFWRDDNGHWHGQTFDGINIHHASKSEFVSQLLLNHVWFGIS